MSKFATDEPFEWERESEDSAEFDDSDDEVEQEPCPACGRFIAEDVPRCPHCGEWVVERPFSAARGRRLLYVLLVIALMAGLTGVALW